MSEFTPSGTFVAKFGTAGSGDGEFSGPTSIASEPGTGDLYVADKNNNRVEEFNPASENAEIFACEEELGRITVADAYLRLAQIEPRLAELMQQRDDATLEASDRPFKRLNGQTTAGDALNAQLHTLIGPSAQHPDPLIRSQLAFSLVSHYRAILNGKLPLEARTESYFSAQRRVVVRSGVLTGPDLLSP